MFDLSGKVVGINIARGGRTVILEGSWDPERIVVAEFPDVESARRWYDSPEYNHAKSRREGIATMEMIVVEGA